MKKNKYIILVVIILVVLAIIIGIEYFITANKNEKNKLEQVRNEEKINIESNETKDNNNYTVVNIPDGLKNEVQKSITINDNEYVVKIAKETSNGKVNSTVYLNNKEIYNYSDDIPWFVENNSMKFEEYDYKDSFELRTIKGKDEEKEYIAIITYNNNGAFMQDWLYILNEEGKIIGNYLLDDGVSGVEIKGETDTNYKINDDNVILYYVDRDKSEDNVVIGKMIITINDDKINENLEREFSGEDVIPSGR